MSIPVNATAKKDGASLVNGVLTADACTATTITGAAISSVVLLAVARCLAAIAMMFTSKCLKSSRNMHTFPRSSLCSIWLQNDLIYLPFRVIYVYTERENTHEKRRKTT